MKQWAGESVSRILLLSRNPGKFFSDHHNRSDFFKQAMIDSGLVWIAITIPLFLITFANLGIIRASHAAFRSLTGSGTDIDKLLPWSQLAFPIFWSAVPLMTGAIRHFFITLLGESPRSFAKTQALTIYAMLPFAALTGISAILSAIFPCFPRPGAGLLACPPLLVGSILIIVGGVYEFLLSIRGLRVVYHQNTGRAVLTWLSPLVLLLLGIMGLYLLSLVLFILFH